MSSPKLPERGRPWKEIELELWRVRATDTDYGQEIFATNWASPGGGGRPLVDNPAAQLTPREPGC